MAVGTQPDGSRQPGNLKAALPAERAVQLERLLDTLSHSLRTRLQTLLADCSLIEVASANARPAAMTSLARMAECIEDMGSMLRHAQELAKASEPAGDDRAGSTPVALAVVAARTLSRTLERCAAHARPKSIELPATTLVAALPAWRVQVLFEALTLGVLGLVEQGLHGAIVDVHIGEPQAGQSVVTIAVSVAHALDEHAWGELSAQFEPFARPPQRWSVDAHKDSGAAAWPLAAGRGRLALARALARSIGGDVHLSRAAASEPADARAPGEAGAASRVAVSVVLAPAGAGRWPVVAARDLRLELHAAGATQHDVRAAQQAIGRARAAIAEATPPAGVPMRLASEREPSEPQIVVEVGAAAKEHVEPAVGQARPARVSVVVNAGGTSADGGTMPGAAGAWRDVTELALADRLILLARQLAV